ncbi:hypothetical protein ILUMI_19980 [Ignelater luminosus]|uniref:C2H2-type domain-containing protein n=1 Tax=Ignelater luminosus TaxID=2038154 RepID=A0A8K0CF52_IGNLU|nr:hypothetical protein ILUMI_19980 [Ignelater luminosus]
MDLGELAEKANVSHIIYFQCGKVYKFSRSLRRHLTYECQKEPQQVCPVCNKRTHLKSNLIQHMRMVYNIHKKDFIDRYDYLYFSQLRTVIDLPVQIELTEADTKDTWLGWTSPPDAIAQDGVSRKKRKSTSSSNRIRGNFISSKKRKSKFSSNRIRGHFICAKCGRSYNRKDSLRRHLTYECGKDPQFQCPFCPRKFKRKAHPTRHIQRLHKNKIGL